MTITRFAAALASLVLVTGLAPSAAQDTRAGRSSGGAQETRAVRSSTAAQTGTADDKAQVERSDDTRQFRFRRPVVRIGQDFRLRADDRVHEIQSVLADVIVDGRVDSDVVVTVGSARLGPTAVIGGSLLVFGGTATIDAGASVGRDLLVIGGTLNAPPTFTAGGDQLAIGTPWLGDALEDMMPWVMQGLLLGRPIVPDIEWVWIVVAIFFLLYLGLNTVLDRPVAASSDMLVERPVSSFMTGLLVLLLSIPAIAIIAATVIGVAVIPFILCALLLAALIGKTAVARAMGRGVLRPKNPHGRIQAFFTFIIGFGVLTVAYMVPVVGLLTWALTGLLGFGAATATFRTYMRRERQAAGLPPDVTPVPAVYPTPPPSGTVASPEPPSPAAAARVEPPPVALVEPAPAPPRIETPPPPPPPRFTEGLAQYPRAAFLDRAAAFAVDCILVAMVNALLDLTRYEGSFLLLLLAYHVAFWAWRGTTLGGIVCSLRVVRTHGADLRPIDALVRGLASVLSIGALGIGCLWMLIDAESQTWHDKVAGTLVVKVPRELVLP